MWQKTKNQTRPCRFLDSGQQKKRWKVEKISGACDDVGEVQVGTSQALMAWINQYSACTFGLETNTLGSRCCRRRYGFDDMRLPA